MRRKRIVAVLAPAVPVLMACEPPPSTSYQGPEDATNKVAIVGDSITGLLRAIPSAGVRR